MTQSTISPLRQRMLDDMALRKLSEKTRFFGRSPDLASPEDLRRFQMQLVEEGVSSPTINATITGYVSILK